MRVPPHYTAHRCEKVTVEQQTLDLVGVSLRAFCLFRVPHTSVIPRKTQPEPTAPGPTHCGAQTREVNATLDTSSRVWEARTQAHWGLLLSF